MGLGILRMTLIGDWSLGAESCVLCWKTRDARISVPPPAYMSDVKTGLFATKSVPCAPFVLFVVKRGVPLAF